MPSLKIPDPALPPNSLILVTGVSGYIGAHVANQTLAAGYRVRGTTRSSSKNAWLKERFTKTNGSDKFELVEVTDMTSPSAFDSAVRGCSGFIHVASDMTFSSDAQKVISVAVNGVLNALEAAKKDGGVKRFVLTSSSCAACLPKPDVEFTVTKETWNEEAVGLAKEKDPDPFVVYAASKTQAERNAREWMEKEKPGFVFNAVLPNGNFGKPIDPTHQGYPSTSAWSKNLLEGNVEPLKGIDPQHFVDVQDDARLHVIALLHPKLDGERIFAFAAPFNFNDMLHIMRELYPKKKTYHDVPKEGQDVSTIVPAKEAEDLLRECYGMSGWTGLKESIRSNTEDLISADDV